MQSQLSKNNAKQCTSPIRLNVSLHFTSNKQSSNLSCYWVINFLIRYILTYFIYYQIPKFHIREHIGINAIEFSLNVFTEFAEYSTTKNTVF